MAPYEEAPYEDNQRETERLREGRPLEAARARRVTITISDDGTGTASIAYLPSLLRINRRDTVTWFSADGPFAVQFKDETPCDQVEAQSSTTPDPVTGLYSTDPLTVRNNTPGGTYHYAVAIFAQSEEPQVARLRLRVHLDAGCPELIVN